MTEKMTREELKEHCKRQVQQFERVEKIMAVTPNDWKRYEEHKLILELLEQQPCEDAVSREAVEKITWEEPTYTDPLNVLTEVREKVRNLPSVTPIRPKDDVLDKIRAEIIEMRSKQNVGVLECLDIIDKYKADKKDCTTCIGFGDKDYAQSFCHDCIKDIQNHYKTESEETEWYSNIPLRTERY